MSRPGSRSARRATRAAALLAALAAAAPLAAQERPGVGFAVQPGVRTIDTFTDREGLSPATGFNLRLLTTIPTGWRRVDLLVGASFSPFGLSHGARIANDPVLYYGASIPLVRAPRTDGWLDLALPLLGAYQFDESGTGDDRLYEHDGVAQLSATLHAGRKLLSDLGPFWSRLDVYAIAEQNLTPDREVATRRRDFFNPSFFYGVSIPLGGRRE